MFPQQALPQHVHDRLQAALGAESVELVGIREAAAAKKYLGVLPVAHVRVHEVRIHNSRSSSARLEFSSLRRKVG